MSYIYFDIETIRGPIPPNAEEADQRLKDPVKISMDLAEKWDKQGLHSVKGAICVACVAVNDDNVQYFATKSYEGERDIITGLWNYLLNHPEIVIGAKNQWVGYNIRKFDMNFLFHRALKYGYRELAKLIPRDRYSKDVIDLYEKWSGADTQCRGKQKEVAEFFGIQVDDTIDGSMINHFWQNDGIQSIINHCVSDVMVTRKLHPILDLDYGM